MSEQINCILPSAGTYNLYWGVNNANYVDQQMKKKTFNKRDYQTPLYENTSEISLATNKKLLTIHERNSSEISYSLNEENSRDVIEMTRRNNVHNLVVPQKVCEEVRPLNKNSRNSYSQLERKKELRKVGRKPCVAGSMSANDMNNMSSHHTGMEISRGEMRNLAFPAPILQNGFMATNHTHSKMDSTVMINPSYISVPEENDTINESQVFVDRQQENKAMINTPGIDNPTYESAQNKNVKRGINKRNKVRKNKNGNVSSFDSNMAAIMLSDNEMSICYARLATVVPIENSTIYSSTPHASVLEKRHFFKRTSSCSQDDPNMTHLSTIGPANYNLQDHQEFEPSSSHHGRE